MTAPTMTHRYAVPSPWLRLRLGDLMTRLAAGQLNRCEHLRDGQAREMVLGLWSDAAVCDRCKPRLRLTGDADSTCDRCGRLSRPTIFPSLVMPAPGVVVCFGLCRSCHEQEVTT